jgi:hypothetical protein
MRKRFAAGLALLAALTAGAHQSSGRADGRGAGAQPVIVGTRSQALTATLRSVRPALRPGSTAARPLPAVTGGSSAVRLGRWTFVAQDDSNFLAAVSDDGRTDAIRLLPPVNGADRFLEVFNNRKLKPDMEAAAVVSVPRAVAERLGAGASSAILVLGSGSAEHYRDRIAVVFPGEPPSKGRVVAVQAQAFYARLRAEPRLTGRGGQLNVESAIVVAGGSHLRLFNRGNGGPKSITASVDVSTADLWSYLARASKDPSAPFAAAFTNACRYDLGATSSGSPVAITDATTLPPGLPGVAGPAILLSAVAEETVDATEDGATSGTILGLLAADGTLLLAPLRDDKGPTGYKVEGIAVVGATPEGANGFRARMLALIDPDATDPSVPSLVAEIELVYAPA